MPTQHRLADTFRCTPEEVQTMNGETVVRWHCESGHHHPLMFAALQCNLHTAKMTIQKWRLLVSRDFRQ